MPKIAIFTFQNVPNYGATLQAFALKEYLQGFPETEAFVVDYMCKGNNEEFSPQFKVNSIKKRKNIFKKCYKMLEYYLFVNYDYTNKYRKFKYFKNNYANLNEYNEQNFEQYDFAFFGSDQIWNPHITGGYNKTYFGFLGDKFSGVKASYAASCGDITSIQETQTEFFELLGNLDYIATREKSLCDFIRQHGGMQCTYTVDPTFLLSRDEYVNKLSLRQKRGSKYLLVYELQENPLIDDVAKRIAKEKKLKIVKIRGYTKPHIGRKYILDDQGPIDFLELLYNAEHVLTNSFHGLAFSLIFNKDFNIILPLKRSDRLTDLLHLVKLDNRICQGIENINFDNINFDDVNNILQQVVRSSKDYILEIIGA